MRGNKFYESDNLIMNLLKVWLETQAIRVLVMASK